MLNVIIPSVIEPNTPAYYPKAQIILNKVLKYWFLAKGDSHLVSIINFFSLLLMTRLDKLEHLILANLIFASEPGTQLSGTSEDPQLEG